MIFEAFEGQTAWFEGISLTDLPAIIPSGLFLHNKRGVLGIEAKGVAGTVPLAGGKGTLVIVPKIGSVNLMRILLKAEGADSLISNRMQDLASYAVNDDASVQMLLVASFFRGLSKIWTTSPNFSRKISKSYGEYPRGRVDWLRTSVRLASRESMPVAFTSKERSHDTCENRFLKAAADRAWVLASSLQHEEFRDIYMKWSERYSAVGNAYEDMKEVEEGLIEGRYGGPRDYYSRPLMIAKIIMGISGIGLIGSNRVSGDAMLLNTADLFEKYLRECVRVGCAARGIEVCKGDGSLSLYANGEYSLEPDILLMKGSECLLVLDAKYKIPDSGDHYQMVCYLRAYGTKRGVLLCPDFSQGSKIAKVEYPTGDGRFVRVIQLPMLNLPAVEAFLADPAALF
jgi:McrBC 5-methylcytosine restriction system component